MNYEETLFKSLCNIERRNTDTKDIQRVSYRAFPLIVPRLKDATPTQKIVLMYDLSLTLLQGKLSARLPYSAYKKGVFTKSGDVVAEPLQVSEQTIRDTRKHFIKLGLYKISDAGDGLNSTKITIVPSKLGELMCLNISRNSRSFAYEVEEVEVRSRLKVGKKAQSGEGVPPQKCCEPIIYKVKEEIKDKRKDQKTLPAGPDSGRVERRLRVRAVKKDPPAPAATDTKQSIIEIAENVKRSTAAKHETKLANKTPNHSMVITEWLRAITNLKASLAEKAESEGTSSIYSKMLSVPWPSPTRQGAIIFIQNFKRSGFPDGLSWHEFMHSVVERWDEYMLYEFHWMSKHRSGNVMLPDLQSFAKMLNVFIKAYSSLDMSIARDKEIANRGYTKHRTAERKLEIAEEAYHSKVARLEERLRLAEEGLRREKQRAEMSIRVNARLHEDINRKGATLRKTPEQIDREFTEAYNLGGELPTWEELNSGKAIGGR